VLDRRHACDVDGVDRLLAAAGVRIDRERRSVRIDVAGRLAGCPLRRWESCDAIGQPRLRRRRVDPCSVHM
jgi:hypothetical protein